CIRSGIAGLWQNVRSRTWRTRGVVGGRYSRYATFTRRIGGNAG
ncbi:FAD-binding oxidoreductase, partial [Escherichia coli]